MGDGVGAKVGVEVAVGAGFVGVGVGERGEVQATKVIATTSKAIVAAFVKFFPTFKRLPGPPLLH